MGLGYADGRAIRASSVTGPKPIFDADEWIIFTADTILSENDFDPGFWPGLDNLEACLPVRCIVWYNTADYGLIRCKLLNACACAMMKRLNRRHRLQPYPAM